LNEIEKILSSIFELIAKPRACYLGGGKKPGPIGSGFGVLDGRETGDYIAKGGEKTS
jgi:hypothetical protein